MSGKSNNAYRAKFGIRNGDWDVFATIGKGNVTIGETHGDTLNRDISRVIKKIEYNIKVDEINAFYQKRDPKAESMAKERLNDAFDYFASPLPSAGADDPIQPKPEEAKSKPWVNPDDVAEKYTVKSGDALSEIAAAKGISLEELKAVNPQITDPNKINAGQKINIPTSRAMPSANDNKPQTPGEEPAQPKTPQAANDNNHSASSYSSKSKNHANNNRLKTREEFEKHFLSKKEWQIHLTIGDVDKAALKSYIDGKYEHYHNGQKIDTIAVSLSGFEEDKFGVILNQYGDEFPKTAKFIKSVGETIEEGIGYVFDKVGGALSVAGTELGKHLNDEVSFNPEHGIISEEHAVNILKPIIRPVHEAIVEFTNDLTPEQVGLIDKANIAGNIIFAGGVIKELGKSFVFRSVTKGLSEGAIKNLDNALEKTVLKLDVEYRQIPVNQRPINIDKAISKVDVSLKDTAQSLLKEENILLARLGLGNT